MSNENQTLKTIYEGKNIKELLNDNFIKNLELNFDNYNIRPIAIAFTIEKDDIVEDTVNLVHRSDEDSDNDILIIDLDNPKHMNNILKSL